MFGAGARDWLDWWLEELCSSWPQRLLPASRAVRPDLVLHVSRSGLRLVGPEGAEALLSADPDDEALTEQISALASKARPTVELRFGRDRFLERRLAAVRLPTRRLFSMAALDLSSDTPLNPADTVLLFPQADGAVTSAAYFVVKRGALEALVGSVERRGAAIVSISLDTAHGVVPASSKTMLPFLRHARAGLRRKRLALLGTIACVFMVSLTLAHAQWRVRDGAWRLSSEMEALEAEAKAVRGLADTNKRRLEQLENVRGYKRQAVSVTRIWDELTRVVPDGSWVTDLAVRDGRVTFSGFSPSAAGLIPELEASPLFANPTFAGPVVRSPDNGSERFTIDMRLQG